MTAPLEPIPPDPASGSAGGTSPGSSPHAGTTDAVPLSKATRAWFAISLQTFGGPAGQIAVMQHKLVDEKRWIGQQRFLHALNYCMLLPGPEAQQLAIYTGWLLNGTRGGLIAGSLFVLPGMVALLALSAVYVRFGETPLVTALFAGVAPAVIAIVVHAVQRVAQRALTNPALVGLATAAFLGLSVFSVPFPVVILVAAVAGWLLGRARPEVGTPAVPEAGGGPEPLISDAILHVERPSWRRSLAVLSIGLAVWFGPVVAVAVLVDSTPVLLDQALFFSGAAVVTFGGAYAVLAYVAQQAVDVYGWLAPGEMVRGLALAESTPGPLIMVVQFVAFVGAYRDPGAFDPWVAALIASLLVTWVTFVPCFLWVLLGAPYVERLRQNAALSSALTGVTAAVVGVIASLAVFFALHTLFDDLRLVQAGWWEVEVPVLTSGNPTAFAITTVALILVFRLRWSPLRTLGACALLGVLSALAASAL